MTSKTSYFDAAIFKRSLRKTMPLWICYLVFWLFILPGDLISFVYQPEYYDSLSGRLCERILNFCTVGSILSALIGLLAAWLLFSWLFRANASYFYASLPVRREVLFVSNFAVGFLMVMLGNFLTALTAYCITLLHGYPQFYACTCFFGTSMLAFTGFYGFAVLLAMIIGQAAAMPAVYVILNFTSSVIYYAVQYLLSDFVYGMSGRTSPAATFFYQLSPIAYIMTYGLSVSPAQLTDGSADFSRYVFSSWGYLASLAVAGIVFAALALLVFRRREMERSGDVIAVKPLRPVFLYCFTIGCAIVLCYVISSMQSSLFGAEAFRRTLLFLIIGAFLGYFIAQMMLQKLLPSSTVQRHGCALVQCAWFLCLAAQLRGMMFWVCIPVCRMWTRSPISTLPISEQRMIGRILQLSQIFRRSPSNAGRKTKQPARTVRPPFSSPTISRTVLRSRIATVWLTTTPCEMTRTA